MDMTMIDSLTLKFERITAGADAILYWKVSGIDEFNYERIGYGETPKIAVDNLLSCWADDNEFWSLEAKNTL
jgi:hypothetical protein